MLRGTLLIGLLTAAFSLVAQSYSKVNATHVEELLKRKTDTTYVLNFFASWCAPCIQELPELQAFAAEHRAEKVKLILVSLDFEEDASESLIPLLQKYAIADPVWLLREDGNRWIARIDKQWNGSIPATIMVNHARKQRLFMQQRVTRELLNQKLLKP